MDHPIEISPLTKKKPSDPNKVERFELFINTWEMCNAYSELNDPIDQRERFKAQDALADAGDEEADVYKRQIQRSNYLFGDFIRVVCIFWNYCFHSGRNAGRVYHCGCGYCGVSGDKPDWEAFREIEYGIEQ